MTKPDVRATGIPRVGPILARLDGLGNLSRVNVRVEMPDGEGIGKRKLLLWFRIEEDSEGKTYARLRKITGAEGSGTDAADLHHLSMGVHLPGVVAAEDAVKDLQQVDTVVGLMDRFTMSQRQARLGHDLECRECGEQTVAKSVLDAADPKAALSQERKGRCPECGAHVGKMEQAR